MDTLMFIAGFAISLAIFHYAIGPVLRHNADRARAPRKVVPGQPEAPRPPLIVLGFMSVMTFEMGFIAVRDAEKHADLIAPAVLLALGWIGMAIAAPMVLYQIYLWVRYFVARRKHAAAGVTE